MFLSGPAKGYIEMLEQRLHETEETLLMVLSRISDEQLLDVPMPDQPNYVPFLRQEKKGTDYWKEFPLNTAHNIRKWQYDNQKSSNSRRNSRQRTIDTNATIGPSDTAIPRTTADSHIQRNRSDSGSASNVSQRASLIDAQHTPRRAWNMARTLPAGQRANGEASRSRTPAHSQNESLSEAIGQSTASNVPREPSQWSEAPSIKFQEQFLW